MQNPGFNGGKGNGISFFLWVRFVNKEFVLPGVENQGKNATEWEILNIVACLFLIFFLLIRPRTFPYSNCHDFLGKVDFLRDCKELFWLLA